MKYALWIVLVVGWNGASYADLVKSIDELVPPEKKVEAPPPPPLPEAPAKPKVKPLSKSSVRASKKSNAEEKELTFASDVLIGSQKGGTAELQGNVKIRHGDLYLRSQKAKMIFDEQTKELARVIAHGEVVLEKNGREPGEMVHASGGKMEYDRKNNMIFLTQDAYLKQGSDVVRGDLIKYNLTTGIVEAQQVQGKVSPAHEENTQGSSRGK